MQTTARASACITAVALLAACGGESGTPASPDRDRTFDKYVSLGTSISMGVQSDGVVRSSQQASWPALLASQAAAPQFTLPLILEPGCPSPIASPLTLGIRTSGATLPMTNAADMVCALVSGITLPTNNLAVNGANTFEALRTTPENAATGSVLRRKQYAAVLPAGKTQVTAMRLLQPTLVSVELGSNEFLSAGVSGLLQPAVAYGSPFTYVPFAVWQPVYSAILDSVAATGARAMLLGVPNVTTVLSLRAGSELYANRAELLTFGVSVSADCNGSSNLVFVPLKVGLAIAAARSSGKAQPLSCADIPGAQDNVISTADVGTLTSLVDAMNAYIRAQASARGWAFVDLDAILAAATATKPSFSVAILLGCAIPYGPYLSLDGVHPGTAGHQLIANAAADALNLRYGLSIPKVAPVLATPCS